MIYKISYFGIYVIYVILKKRCFEISALVLMALCHNYCLGMCHKNNLRKINNYTKIIIMKKIK